MVNEQDFYNVLKDMSRSLREMNESLKRISDSRKRETDQNLNESKTRARKDRMLIYESMKRQGIKLPKPINECK